MYIVKLKENVWLSTQAQTTIDIKKAQRYELRRDALYALAAACDRLNGGPYPDGSVVKVAK